MAREKKRAYHHGDLARALTEAATTLVEERGPDGLTLREVAAAVGVTHTAAYRHFEDKTALLASIADAGFRELAARLDAAVAIAAGDAIERLRAFGEAYVAFAMDHPAQYGVMFGPRLNESGRFPALEESIGAVVMALVREIDAGQKAGVVRAGRKRDVGMSIWVFSHGYCELVHRRRVKVKNRAVAIEYFHTLYAPLLAGLRPAPSPREAR